MLSFDTIIHLALSLRTIFAHPIFFWQVTAEHSTICIYFYLFILYQRSGCYYPLTKISVIWLDVFIYMQQIYQDKMKYCVIGLQE